MIFAALIALAIAVVAPALHPTRVEQAFKSSTFVTSDGVRLHVLEAGATNTAGPVLAFVPGWSMPAAIWKKPLALLARDFHVVALDPRGQGESEIPTSGYSVERRAEDVGEFVAHYPGAVLVAWSLGALESLEYVHAHGEAGLSGLVIVDSSVGEGPAPPPQPPDQPGSLRAELRRDRSGTLNGFVRAIFHTTQPEADLVALRDGALRMPLESSLSLFPGDRIPREHWRAIVHEFKKPLLYVVTPQFAAQAETLKSHRPASRTALFEDAGHALFVDEPERFATLLGEFASRLPCRAQSD